jgi:hypothetical protein
MLIEISDPSYLVDLSRYLQKHGCPCEKRTEETFEVRVLWTSGAPLTDAQMRAKVFGHVRVWCADHPGIKANLLS